MRGRGSWLVAGLCLLLAGCASPAYYTQAISGHLGLMHSREPIPEVLARLPAEDPTAQRLRQVQSILAFADETLALPAGDSYQTFAPTPGAAVTWNVIATPAFSLEPRRWCFPVAGCVPYRGYFEQAAAERFAARLRRKNLDVAVAGAQAYSTLGWFDDPVLGSMLRGSPADLAAVLFHELAHQALYINGATAFNEAYATFLEREGVRAWMSARGDFAALARWEAREAARDTFLALLRDSRDELAGAYAREAEGAELAETKAQLFATLERRYRTLVDEQWQGQDRFGGWFDPPPNNADLALIGSYTGGLCAFERLWLEAGRNFTRLHQLARRQGALAAPERAAWLATPCPERKHSAAQAGERRTID